ncbi:MAG: IS110 family transposase [Acidimicrobiia bacterium]
MLFVGNDWSEDHHDIWVMSETGEKLAVRRLDDGVEGIGKLHQLMTEYVDDPGEVAVGIETDRGLWVQALVAVGYQVYAVNPRSAARYRERHGLSGAKSDRGDAKLLADLVRTDRHNHRQVAGDSPEVQAITVLARAHRKLIRERTRHTLMLRSALREYYPQAVATFDELADRDTLAVLQRAPAPNDGARLSLSQIRAALKRAGRQRYLDKRATEIQAGLWTDQLAAPGPVTSAYAATTRATVAILIELNRQISELEEELATDFEQHPDADIYLSQPGLGVVLGARVLGEFGDDPDRFADVKSRRNYAGTSPVTIASGKHRSVIARYVRNDRLYDAIDRWALSSLNASVGCRNFYDQHKAQGDTHSQALRALANRLVGILHGCLRTRTTYDEHTAWAHRQPSDVTAAA